MPDENKHLATTLHETHAHQRFRRQLFHILHKPSPDNPAARYVNYVLAALIVFNCFAVALETDAAMLKKYGPIFDSLERVSTALFLIEYLLRVWVCVEQERFSKSVFGRIKYALQPLTLLDLIAVASYLTPIDLRFLRVFRISRLLRVLKMGDLEHSYHAIAAAVSARKAMLLVSVAMMAIAIYFSASVLYILEHKAQPDKFSSIPETLWWAVMTLTTIGYGDIIPITPAGKFCASLLSIFGIGLFALPTAILTTAIMSGAESGSEKPGHKHCHHCGKSLE